MVIWIMNQLPGIGTGPGKPLWITGKKSKNIYNNMQSVTGVNL